MTETDVKSKGNRKGVGDATWSATIHNDVRELERVWRDLETTGHATAFQRYDWVAPWYAAVTAAGLAEPMIVAARRRGARDPEFLLPLALHVEKRLRTITMADLRVSDYAAPVMAANLGLTAASFQPLWAAILEALPVCDLIRLRKIPAQYAGTDNPLVWLRGVIPFVVSAYGLPISLPFEACCRERFGKERFRKVRSAWNRLHALQPIEFVVHSGTQDADTLFETFVQQRQARFRALGRPDIYEEPVWQGFYRSITRGHHGRPIGVVSALLGDGRPFVTNFGVVFNGAFHDLAQGFVPSELDKFSPGTLLNYRTMQWAAESGLTYYDFTVGDEPYKRQLGSGEVPLYEWISPRSSLGMAAFGLWRGKRLLDRIGGRRA